MPLSPVFEHSRDAFTIQRSQWFICIDHLQQPREHDLCHWRCPLQILSCFIEATPLPHDKRGWYTSQQTNRLRAFAHVFTPKELPCSKLDNMRGGTHVKTGWIMPCAWQHVEKALALQCQASSVSTPSILILSWRGSDQVWNRFQDGWCGLR